MNKTTLFVGVVFNGYWFLAVWGQYHYILFLQVILLCAWLCFRGSILFSLCVAMPGIWVDLLLKRFGFFSFPNSTDPLYQSFDPILPFWLILLWLGFASMVWIMRETLLSLPMKPLIVLGSVGGALSYLAGEKLGAVTLPIGVPLTLPLLMLIWAALSYFLLKMLPKFSRLYARCQRHDSV